MLEYLLNGWTRALSDVTDGRTDVTDGRVGPSVAVTTLADRRQFARSHFDGDTCLGTDGCNIRRGSERARAIGGASAHGCRRGARGYGGGGYKLTLQQFYFSNISSRLAPCPSTPSPLCKELWCGSLALKLVGGGLCPLLFVR
jgi:hypothetical protein